MDRWDEEHGFKLCKTCNGEGGERDPMGEPGVRFECPDCNGLGVKTDQPREYPSPDKHGLEVEGE